MNIRFSDYDLSSFLVKEGTIAGLPALLIQPNHIGTKFNQHNKIFRSSIWSMGGELLSASYYKFVNWGENPENFPTPTGIGGWVFVDKIDGSCVIVDYINEKFSARTRGTFTYTGMDNADDFELAFKKYPKIADFVKKNPQYSLLMEIMTPNLKIVLNYGEEIDFFLTGCVDKKTYSLLNQNELDAISLEIGVKRPEYYQFPSIDDLIKDVGTWKGKEGVVTYSPDGQSLFKIKSMWYLCLHRMKESLASIDKVIDVWFEQGQPSYQEFEQFIVGNFDWELWTQCRGDASRICDGYKEVKQIMTGMKVFVNEVLGHLPTRKEQAEKVISSYGQTNRASFVFKLLDKKPLTLDDQKKLLYQVLKK